MIYWLNLFKTIGLFTIIYASMFARENQNAITFLFVGTIIYIIFDILQTDKFLNSQEKGK